ncbi:MAG: fasciclin domain-containing protein, partial [Bacteroidales bacterium]|nr:fasciclin domain-containing protein [Bacteroidales bacterium]
MMRYYDEPDWIKGSLYEILQDKGNYTLFLQGVDSCGYTALLQGRSILTVMAPDDAAMRTWLQNRYGTTDIASLPKAELKKLIGFHILYYALDSEKLINFRPSEGDGATDEQKLKNAGLFYKFRTRSQDAPEKVSPERIVVNDAIVDTSGIEVDVYHLERF